MAVGNDAREGVEETTQKRRCAADWSDLPTELVRHISHHLTSTWDFLRFRGVCSSWRSAAIPADLPPQIPSLLLPYDSDTTARSFLDPADRRVHTIDIPEARGKWLLGTPHGWLVMLGEQEEDEEGRMFTVSLLNPITRSHILLPPLPGDFITLPEQRGGSDSISATKASLTSNPPCKHALLAIFVFSKLAICSIDGESWRVIDFGVPPRFMVDFTYFEGAFYVVDSSRGITVLDTTSLKKTYSAPTSRRFLPLGNRLHLVESNRNLLLLERSRGFPSVIEVFKLDRSESEKLKWVRAEGSIGDRALFMSNDHSSVSLPSSDFVGRGGDLICFADDDDYAYGYRFDRAVAAHLCISDVEGGRSIGRRPYYWIGTRRVHTAKTKNLVGLTWITPNLC